MSYNVNTFANVKDYSHSVKFALVSKDVKTCIKDTNKVSYNKNFNTSSVHKEADMLPFKINPAYK